MKTKQKLSHQRNVPEIDLNQVAAELEDVVGESVSGVMTQHGVTLLLLWHESWLALKASNVSGLEVIQLNAELIQVGRIMQAFSIISPNASERLNYAVFSLTQHHVELHRCDGHEIAMGLEVQSGEGDSSFLCQKDYYATTQN